MEYIYRVVLKINYYEVHFDFKDSVAAVNFCAAALDHMTDREDGKECHMTVKKINVEKEKAAEAETEKEDN